ncbi:MAG: DMT family transporter [Pseudomonadota bacterium]
MSKTRSAGLWMIGAVICFSSMAIAGRLATVELDTFEVMTYRSFVGIALVLICAGFAGTLNQISTCDLGLHLGRNICHFTGQNLWFAALSLVPLAQLFALEFTSPLWVMVLAVVFLGEKLTRRQIALTLLAFAGVLIVARPGAGLSVGVIFAALSAIGFAGSIILTKRLTHNHSITSILFWLTIMQAILGLLCCWIDGAMAWPSLATWPSVVLIGVAGLGAHFCLTTALSLAPATRVIPIDFIRLPLIAVIGMALYGEPIDGWVFLGGALIFLANYLNLLRPGAKTEAEK